ncbi:hypothetical protein GCM10011400_69630 [Paraburkholderia caffeinilytica]|uniref:TauD/TfdA-like domain-containing protein n=1 Tax=Paraburkholderia caffeinilytica TaxID=1761016 RepID=A0ABQ1NCX1_9BURK|nr:hypothetical protein GCM10011400_69630 [Paraburkholderia caffeinilytica]CAB3805931.1 hypothetical protein LMG28690_06434 [Paraburkholderia caffeinilytica]
MTFVDAYPQASILRGVTIPDVGGDTVLANTATAYDDLPPPLKALKALTPLTPLTPLTCALKAPGSMSPGVCRASMLSTRSVDGCMLRRRRFAIAEPRGDRET